MHPTMLDNPARIGVRGPLPRLLKSDEYNSGSSSHYPVSIVPQGRLFIYFLVMVLMTTITSHAQDFRGTISGKITDSSGAVIPNASIVAVGPQQTYRAVSGGDGAFTIPFIQPATYAVTVSAKGFNSEQRPGILIDINTRVNLPVALQVGSTTQTVVVQGTAGLSINTEDASGGTIMDPEKVQQLPLNGRQTYMLLSLTPGTQFTQTQFGSSGYSGTRGWDESNSY